MAKKATKKAAKKVSKKAAKKVAKKIAKKIVKKVKAAKKAAKKVSKKAPVKRVEVIKESGTGRNRKFLDNKTGETMTRAQFVKKIEKNIDGLGDNYHIRDVNGIKTPVSNPNRRESDNLG